jgi:copper chaperone CopZ
MSKEQTYVITDMSCEGCGGSVTNVIQQADGAASVSVKLESGRVILQNALSEEAMRPSVENVGFDFDSRAA